ncbi:MAG: hypothetical protein PHX61_06230 [Alphaproteobacteria bacterium]|nr:hypothetical protein [Alphaproteobacteria bacterium]
MKQEVNFKNLDALVPVEKVIREAESAMHDSSRTVSTSSIPEVLGGVSGMGVGAAGSFTALYFLGTTGLSAAGITSALATAGALVGGGMVAGIGVLAAPVAILGVAGYGIFAHKKYKKLIQAKEALLQRAIQLRDGIIRQLKATSTENKERLDYLNKLNTLLQAAIKDLQADLAK